MKILFTADWHISERHTAGGAGGARALADFQRAAAALVHVADIEEIDAIVHLGDVFDRPRPTPTEYQIAHGLIRELATRAPVYILEGNHDREDTQHALAPLVELSRAGLPVHVIDRPLGLVLATGVMLWTLPYPPPKARLIDQWKDKAGRNAELGAGLDLILEDLAADLDPDVCNILAAHVTFAGSRYGESRTVGQWDLAVPVEPLGHFTAVFAGHLHVRQAFGHFENAHYVGPITRWSFGDAGNPCGFVIYDTDTGARDWHDIAGGLDFVTVDAADPTIDGGDNQVVRITGEVGTAAEYLAVEAGAMAVRGEFAAVRNDVTVTKTEGALRATRGDTVADVFAAYVDARPDAVPEDMRAEVEALAGELVQSVR